MSMAVTRNRIATVPVRAIGSRRIVWRATLHAAKRVPSGNRLLATLPRKDRLHFIAGCEEVNLAMSEVLFESGDRIRHVHFPTAGFISLVTPIDGSTRLEVGLVGDEGLVGTPLVLGVATSPLRALVQGAGSSLRMDATSFRQELGRSPDLQQLLDRYLFVRMTQLAQAAGCTRFHLVEARLARWLLMTQDRAHSNAFHITHEFLALMLGVRRVGVTKAASSLQKLGLVRYTRGDIVIRDRPGLKAASCACYRADRESYDRVLG
jgi:CRP-like cAMP-binding protein